MVIFICSTPLGVMIAVAAGVRWSVCGQGRRKCHCHWESALSRLGGDANPNPNPSISCREMGPTRTAIQILGICFYGSAGCVGKTSKIYSQPLANIHVHVSFISISNSFLLIKQNRYIGLCFFPTTRSNKYLTSKVCNVTQRLVNKLVCAIEFNY